MDIKLVKLSFILFGTFLLFSSSSHGITSSINLDSMATVIMNLVKQKEYTKIYPLLKKSDQNFVKQDVYLRYIKENERFYGKVVSYQLKNKSYEKISSAYKYRFTVSYENCKGMIILTIGNDKYADSMIFYSDSFPYTEDIKQMGSSCIEALKQKKYNDLNALSTKEFIQGGGATNTKDMLVKNTGSEVLTYTFTNLHITILGDDLIYGLEYRINNTYKITFVYYNIEGKFLLSDI